MVKKIGKYELGKTLGQGTFGKVKCAVDTADGKRTPYAIKILDRKQIEKENMQEQLKNEIAIMKMLKHEHVVRMFEVIQSPQHIYIVLEIITGGELFDRIVAAKRFDEGTARRYFQQLIQGVHYCHVQGVAHRDLKPENLLLDASDSLKISDFGLSAISHDNQKSKLLQTTCGTPNYVAPEVLKEKGYDGMIADVWSCGVILFVMLAGYLPFDDSTMNGLFLKIERGEYRIPKTFSPPVKNLISRMLTVDPAKRVKLTEVIDDAWFQQGLTKEELEHMRNATGKKVMADIRHAITDSKQDVVNVEAGQGGESKGESNDYLTAFELASRLVMGSLSPLLAKSQIVRRNTQFIANGSTQQVTDRLQAYLQKLNANPSATKNGLKGYVNAAKDSAGAGLMQYVITILPTVCKELSHVEMRRARGDTLQFQKFYRELVRDLSEICPKQPPSISLPEDEQ
jgi:serine/threonine protein kinase